MSVVTTPAVLLRSFPYSETSRVLRFYTESLGIVGVMAKGVRRSGSKSGGGLDTFTGGALTLYVKSTRDLQTLRDFSPTRARRGLASDVHRFAAAAVLAELVLRHAGEESNPELFRALEGGLDRVEAAEAGRVPGVLLAEAWRTVAVLGYRPEVHACVACGSAVGDAMARFDFAQGGVRCAPCAATAPAVGPRLGPGARAQLASLCDGVVPPDLDRPRAHLRLLSDFITYHVSGTRPLQAFAVLSALLPPGDDEADA
ncbi:MAG: DNA repair protein RecO [Gemmatimonadetes bacterium]|nr:DNA repair protein RecO [Gemmatimonadota bacterium]